jgi:hypothetical protein
MNVSPFLFSVLSYAAISSLALGAPDSMPDAAPRTTTETVSTDHGATARSFHGSIVLHDGCNWTLVPHGALLHIPESLQSRVSGRPLGNLISWQEFLHQNRRWLGAERVTLRQADGKQEIDPRRLDYLNKQPKLIVATYEDRPIAMAPAAIDGPQTVSASTSTPFDDSL